MKGTIGVNSVITDAARRASDAINAYVTFRDRDELMHKWIAIRLADGSHDGTLYDSKRDAVRHQLDEYLCAYISFRNLIRGTNPKEMQIFLDFNREAYDNGFRLPDPDSQSGGPAVLMTTAQHDFLNNQLKKRFWDRNAELWERMIRGEH